MKNMPTQARALKKRSALLEAAVTEFSRTGFEAATAKTIAAVAGVATGTFYQHFNNKEEILRVIAKDRYEQQLLKSIKPEIQELSDNATNSTVIQDLFVRTLSFVYDFHAQEKGLHQVLEQRRISDPELQLIMQNGEAVLQERVLHFVKNFNQPDAELVAYNLFSMAEGLVHRHVFSDSSFNREDVIRVGVQMLLSYFKH